MPSTRHLYQRTHFEFATMFYGTTVQSCRGMGMSQPQGQAALLHLQLSGSAGVVRRTLWTMYSVGT